MVCPVHSRAFCLLINSRIQAYLWCDMQLININSQWQLVQKSVQLPFSRWLHCPTTGFWSNVTTVVCAKQGTCMDCWNMWQISHMLVCWNSYDVSHCLMSIPVSCKTEQWLQLSINHQIRMLLADWHSARDAHNQWQMWFSFWNVHVSETIMWIAEC